MQVFRHLDPLRAALAHERQQRKRISLVPTMGNLHAGHLALVEKAKAHSDRVVTSIFVNPLQFGLNEDWDKYPRTFEADSQKLRKQGCDYLFFPDEGEIYPNGMAAQTRVIVPGMTDRLCGASRPGHFEGVTTVVSKLLNIVQPDVAVFGLKDFQQIAIIRRMVQDLCLPVTIMGGEIVREADGLAMSSRNYFITEAERPRANHLYQTLCWLKQAILAGERDYRELETQARQSINTAGFGADYIQICCSDTLMPAGVDDVELTVLGAMYTQAARLIDNIALRLPQ
ncbi:MAG: pantoate--beta-alanine ligase [Cellvibrionaceae bacterium]|nr:pantoate--beta-alanine ligase [Cellvibrionaceae bacterium]